MPYAVRVLLCSLLATSGGLVATEDDLEFMWATDAREGSATERTASQLLPSFGGGLFGELRREHVGLRLHMRSLNYVEVYRGEILDTTSYVLLGAEVLWWF